MEKHTDIQQLMENLLIIIHMTMDGEKREQFLALDAISGLLLRISTGSIVSIYLKM